MATKAVTEQGIKFWILELLAEDPKAQWFDIEKFFMRELRSGRLGYPHVNQARNIYRQIRSRYPQQTGETQRRSA
jgi:hypothetical protein